MSAEDWRGRVSVVVHNFCAHSSPSAGGDCPACLELIDALVALASGEAEKGSPTASQESEVVECDHGRWKAFRDSQGGHIKCLVCGELIG